LTPKGFRAYIEPTTTTRSGGRAAAWRPGGRQNGSRPVKAE
jgi:hypothetical protein